MVLTILKNISQLGLSFQIYGKIQNVPNHQSDIYIYGYFLSVLTTQSPIESAELVLNLPRGRQLGCTTPRTTTGGQRLK